MRGDLTGKRPEAFASSVSRETLTVAGSGGSARELTKVWNALLRARSVVV